MIKYFFSILCVIAIAVVLTSAAPNPQYHKFAEKSVENGEEEHVDDLEDGTDKDDLKGSASYGYGYYGYPLGGYYGSYPYNYYGLYGGYYGGYYPYYGGYGFHGHYFR